jgi:tape measure domain-containing protein
MTGPKIRYDIEANASGEAEVRSLAEQLEKLDDAVDPAAAARAQALGAELRKLGESSSALQTFQRALVDANEASRGLEQSTQALSRLEKRLEAVQAPTRAQAGQLEKLRDATKRAQDAYNAKTEALSAARSRVQQLGVDTGNLAAAENRLAAATTTATTQGRALVTSYQQQAEAARQSAAAQGAASKEVGDGLDGIGRRLDSLRSIGIAGILGSQTAQLLGSVGQTADAFNNLRARMQLVTGEGAPLQQAMQGVETIALSTGQSLENTGTLFSRILTAGRELGLAQEDALQLTQTINQAVAVSGASAASSSAALAQFIQGLQSGVLRGEEFNSVVEQTPRIAQALADGLGVTRGELRGLANDGKLTSQALLQALQSQRATLEREFGQLPLTIGRAVENLQTKWTAFVGSLDGATGASRTVAAGINGIAESLDELGAIAGRAGAVLVAALAIQGVGALRAMATQTLTTAGTMGVLSKSIADVPKFVNIAVAVTGFEIGFQLGDMLRENSELARKFGIGVAEFMTGIVNDLQFLKEAAVAIFTDDTIGEAFDRFRQRAQEQEAIYADLYREAEQAPSAVRAAAAAAAQSTEQLGAVAQATAATLTAAGGVGAAGVAKVGQAADTARDAITALADAAGVRLPALATTAAQQAAAMADLAAKSREAAERIGKEIPAAIAKLSGPELQRFRDTFALAMDESAKQSGLLTTVLAETGKRAAQALGVDVAQATNTLSAEFVKAEENLQVLVGSVGGLRAAGLDAGAVVTAALRKMAETADVQSEFAALRSRVEALGKAGVITKDQMADLLDTIRGKAREAADGVDKLAQAYRQLGVQSQAELQAIADKSRQAWELIKNDATASIATKQAAFTRYAEAVLAANGGVVTSTLQTEARSLGLAIQAEKTGKAIVSAMGSAAGAVDRVGARFDEAGSKAAKAAEQVNKFAERLNTTASGIGIPSGLSPSTLPPVKQIRTEGFTINTPPPDASGDWQWIPQLNKNRAGGEWRLTPAGLKRRSDAARVRREMGLPVRLFGDFEPPPNADGSPAPSPAPIPVPSVAPLPPVPSPAPGPAVVDRLVKLEIVVVGAGTARGLASEDFADQFLELIERARRSAGG